MHVIQAGGSYAFRGTYALSGTCQDLKGPLTGEFWGRLSGSLQRLGAKRPLETCARKCISHQSRRQMDMQYAVMHFPILNNCGSEILCI